VSEHFDGCLCAGCLLELQEEYKKMLRSTAI